MASLTMNNKEAEGLLRVLNVALDNFEMFTEVNEEGDEFFDTDLRNTTLDIRDKIRLMLRPKTTMTTEQKLTNMGKQDLSTLMNNLYYKIASGRHTGADKEILDKAVEIYVDRFEKGKDN
jgi:hypothetical protein